VALDCAVLFERQRVRDAIASAEYLLRALPTPSERD
jgi:hypothetical protein